MYAPTPFQFLPSHIVQHIVDYVVDSIRVRFNKDGVDLKRHEKLLIPLQWVCRNFRYNLHSRFFSECELSLPSSNAEASDSEASDYEASDARINEPAGVTWPSSPQAPVYPTYHLVKTLRIWMDSWEAYSGEALRMLSVPPYDDVAFPLAKKLSVVLHYSSRRKGYKGSGGGFPDYTQYNIRDFVGRVAEMAPTIGEVYIDMRDETTDEDHEGEGYFTNLSTQLFEIGNMTVFYDPRCEMAHHINLDYIQDLVRLTSYVDYMAAELLPLTRRSAQTLQYLDIRLYFGADITGLIQDPDSGEYAEYPQLRTLKMGQDKKNKAYRKIGFGGAIPFPSLQRLCIKSLYPFDDDVFFRGNAATLEYLALSLCQNAIDILSRRNVFTPVSHPRLQCVNIVPLSKYTPNGFNTAAAYLEFVMSIAPGASVRQVYEVESYSKDIAPALLVLGTYACIQVLSLPGTCVSIWQAISLIKSLPLLSDLTTGAPRLGELPQGVSPADLPDYVRSNYAPMGKRFRCWHTYYCYEDNIAVIATVVLLLALACPNFDYVALDVDRKRERFMKAAQEKIAEPGFSQDAPRLRQARLLQKVDKSIPWYRLAAKYHLSIGTLQIICNLAEVDVTLRQQQSALAVASELDTPLVECLDLFDASNSTIQPRSLIETYGGWSKTDVEKLKLFMATNYTDGSNVDWKLAGIYMNVRSFECQRVGQGTFSDTISEVGYRRICELRESTLSWKDIHQYFLQYPSEKSLMSRYHECRRGLEGFATEGLIARLTDEERDRMKDLIEQHMESTTILELVDIIKRELPARLKSDISIFSRQYVHELKAGRMNMNQMIQMRELVDEYGDDWDCIGKALGVPPSRARRNWLEHSGDVGNNSALSIDEARQLQQLIDSGIKPQEATRLLRIRLYRAYQDKSPVAKSLASRRRDAALSGSPWAAADDETLLKIVHGTTISGAIRWEQVSMVLDRSISACKQRLSAINRKRSRKQALDERVNSVTSEAQRQIKLNGAVDWSQVCQATGLGMHECLELSQHDVGKASWHYDPDSFSHSMVDRMTSFIEEYYLAPVPVNSRAVSNFMWVAMGDCIRIHNMFQGKFMWTDAEYAQAEALRAQGLTFKEVARRVLE
ncbi:hypothetical protein GGH13_003144, partial [Coemansia sp. S155-1]